MKRNLPACLLVMLILCGTSLVAQTKKPISREGLVNAVKVFFDAVKQDKYDTIKSYYAADYTFTGPNGLSTNGDERIRLLKQQGGGNFLGASDLNYRIYGDAAVVTGIAATKTASGGTDQSRFIQVWVMQGGNLRLVASQVTKIE
jgi:limonene-1,2-epoxide hydrolase